MKRLALAALFGIAALGGGAVVWASGGPGGTAVPTAIPVAAGAVAAPLRLTGRIVDDAHLLDALTKETLAVRLSDIEHSYGPQLVVVTTSSLHGKPIEQYGLALGNGWGIGNKQRDDGVLLVVAPNEHKTRIEVGKGLEKILPDELCAKIIHDDLIPQFRQGRFREGIVIGIDRLSAILKAHPTLPGASA